MNLSVIHRTLFAAASLLLLLAWTALADRPGWNEPGRAPGYDANGLLKINTDFFEMSAATGGDFYFWAPNEFAAAGGLLGLPAGEEPILLAYGSGKAPFERTFDIPVDSTLKELSLFAGAQRLDGFDLRRPDLRSVQANPAGVTIQELRHMRIVTVVDPEPGLWQVALGGAGYFELAARGRSDRAELRARELDEILLHDFAFVAKRGWPGHEGLAPVDTPSSGTEQACQVTLTGTVDLLEVALVSATGEVLKEVPTKRMGASENDLFGRCRVPTEPFRVQVRGRDSEGMPFQRVTESWFVPGSL